MLQLDNLPDWEPGKSLRIKGRIPDTLIAALRAGLVEIDRVPNSGWFIVTRTRRQWLPDGPLSS